MDVREALLEAAIKVYADAGMRGATTRRIAQTANVNEVTLFRHFRRKSDLMEAALAHVTSLTIGNSLPERPVHPRSELVAWCRAHHRELYKRRALIRKAMSEFEQDPHYCARGMRASVRIAQELREYLRRVKEAGLAAGSWDERAATNMLMGAMFADAMGRDTMPERYSYSMRSAIDLYVDLLLRAIGADAAPTT
jgi:AcrR family transcriptional regulator